MNYKEFFGRYQHSLEGRQQMGLQKEANLQEKYRMSGAMGKGLSFEQFKDIRSTQMSQLYNAYNELNHGTYNRLMGQEM